MRLARWEKNLLITHFAIVWVYIVIRAFTVFYVHDEIVTKWGYMIEWNPLPYQGFMDANNHFLISLLGGAFIRIFQSDAAIVCRLASVLAFPVWYWAILSMRPFFKFKSAHWFLLIGLCSIPWLLDFFSLARGYAMAWSFMMLAICATMFYYQNSSFRHLLLLTISWLLAAYANLAFLPIVIFGLGIAFLTAAKQRQWIWMVIPAIAFAPMGYLIKYSFDLKANGNLYLGESSNFINTTVGQFIATAFGSTQLWLSTILLILITILSLGALLYQVRKRNIQPLAALPIFLLAAWFALFTAHYLFGVNFPETRAAGHIFILLVASLAFLLNLKWGKWPSFLLIALVAIHGLLNLNFTYTREYKYNLVLPEMITSIPATTNGAPTALGGRFWAVENEMMHRKEVPSFAFQNVQPETDTLFDYMLMFPDHLSERAQELYKPAKTFEYTNFTLFKRKQPVTRKIVESKTVDFNNEDTYTGLINTTSTPSFIRLRGQLFNHSIYENVNFSIDVKDTVSQETYLLEGLGSAKSFYVDEQGEIEFDFTFTVNRYSENLLCKVYIFNPNHHRIEGMCTSEVWAIE